MRRSVVIVDDEPTFRMLIRVTVERDGRFEVLGEAADGAQALERVEALEPELLLLDLGMPVMDGLQVLERLQGRSAPTVVVLTGFSEPETHRRALELGAAACLVKGPDFDELLEVLADPSRWRPGTAEPRS